MEVFFFFDELLRPGSNVAHFICTEFNANTKTSIVLTYLH